MKYDNYISKTGGSGATPPPQKKTPPKQKKPNKNLYNSEQKLKKTD